MLGPARANRQKRSTMKTKDGDDAERFARIDALMEEYRLNHEDLEAYVRMVRERAAAGQTVARENLRKARRRRRSKR